MDLQDDAAMKKAFQSPRFSPISPVRKLESLYKLSKAIEQA